MGLTRGRVVAVIGLALLIVLALAAAIAPRSAERASANPLGGFSTIGGGVVHSCGLMTDASVKCWGAIGLEGPIPNAIPGLSPAGAVASGLSHSCAVKSDGTVACFGGDYGSTPVAVPAFGSDNVSISAGRNYTCTLKTGANVACYFIDGSQLLTFGVGPGVTQVATSTGFHTCVLKSDQTVRCWGFNEHGQLGNGTTTGQCCAGPVSGLSNAVQISLGTFYSCALTSAGGVKCWGDGFGLTPVDVPGLTSGITQISANSRHLCALTTGGGVKCRGANHWGQLGDNKVCGQFCTTPVNVDGLSSGVASIGTGVNHSCAVMTAGTAKCWGLNALGNLGIGEFTRQSNVPRDVVASTVKPTPTPTPCAGSCPTATPTPLVDRTGLDYSLAVDANGDNVDDCQTVSPGPAICNLQVNATFELKIYLNSLPPDLPGGVYAGIQLKVLHSGGVAPKDNSTWPWPDCLFDVANYDHPTFIPLGCVTTLTGSAYTGLVAKTVFTCQKAGTVALEHGSSTTLLLDTNNNPFYFETPGISDQLTINCVELPPTPTFTVGPAATSTPPPVGGVGVTEGRTSRQSWMYYGPGLAVLLCVVMALAAPRLRSK